MDAAELKTSDHRVEIRLFGVMDLRFCGVAVAPPKAKKAQLLLGYLLTRQGLPALRSSIASMLWPDSHDEVARFNLRQLLRGLRKDLGPIASLLDAGTSPTLAFHTDEVWLDIREFERNVRSDPRAALVLVRGPFLEGLSAEGLGAEWLDMERRRLEAARLDALELLAESSDFGERSRWLTELVQADPFRESAQQKLIRHLTRAGDLAGAARAYRQFEDRLRQEMNVAPSAETRRLFEDTAREFGVRPSERKGNLPLSGSPFIGRESETLHVRRLLDNGRLVTLTGSGGIGKTRLSLHAAEQALPQWRDGVWLVELAPLADPGLIANVVAETLGVREAPGIPIHRALMNHLECKELLLVLDNCEHVLNAVAGFAQSVLQICPDVKILATSRERLGIAFETAFRLPSLSVPPVETRSPEEVKEYASVRVFAERACACRSDFVIDERNAACVASICRRLDGIPLAIELAAARVSSMPVDQIEARLDDCFQILTGGSRTALPRQKTLIALIDWSYRLLSPKEQSVLARLSVFAGSWSLESAETVCAGGSIEQGDVLDLLTALVDKSLVVFGEGGQPRYRLLETVRQFSQGRLAEVGETERTKTAHRDHFFAMASRSHPELLDTQGSNGWSEFVSGMGRLDIEHENLRAALDWTLSTQSVRPALLMCGILQMFWEARGLISEGREYTRRALELPGSEPWPSERAWALGAAGNLARYQGDYAAARTLIESSLAIREEIEDWRHLCWNRVDLGHIAAESGDHAGACEQYRIGLEVARKIDHRVCISRCLAGLAAAELAMGEYGSAKEHFEETLAISLSVADGYGAAKILQALGELLLRTGDFDAARVRLAESLEMLLPTGERVYTIDAVELLGLLAVREGRGELAAILFGAAESFRTETGSSAPAARAGELAAAVEEIHGVLGDRLFQRSWVRGKALSQGEAMELALGLRVRDTT